jgi:metal-sulfur cluster biosynthetic enzyme
VPSGRAPDLSFFLDILQTLEDIDAPYMIIGAFAAAVYGVSRTTYDIDIVVELDEEHIEALAAAYPVPRYYADPEALRQAILARLSTVIDPETGVDVVRMRLIEELAVDEEGSVSYTFRPSSPFCPIAVFLAMSIKEAVAAVPGVSQQVIRVVGYVRAEELTELINQAP